MSAWEYKVWIGKKENKVNDFITSLIRTYVPIIIGSVAAWLTAKGITIDSTAIAGLTAFLSGLFSAVYYVVVRLIERKYSRAGILLGRAKEIHYLEPPR